MYKLAISSGAEYGCRLGPEPVKKDRKLCNLWCRSTLPGDCDDTCDSAVRAVFLFT